MLSQTSRQPPPAPARSSVGLGLTPKSGISRRECVRNGSQNAPNLTPKSGISKRECVRNGPPNAPNLTPRLDILKRECVRNGTQNAQNLTPKSGISKGECVSSGSHKAANRTPQIAPCYVDSRSGDATLPIAHSPAFVFTSPRCLFVELALSRCRGQERTPRLAARRFLVFLYIY